MKRSQAPSKALSGRAAISVPVEDLSLFTPGSSQLSGMNSYQQKSSQVANNRQSPRLVEKQKDAESSMEIINLIREGAKTQLFTDVEMEILQSLSDEEIRANLTVDLKKVPKNTNKKGIAIIESYI